MSQDQVDERAFFIDANDGRDQAVVFDSDAVLDDEPLPRLLAERDIDALAHEEIDRADGSLEAIRPVVTEYVARQFFMRECPPWPTSLIEALILCIDLTRPLRVGVLPGDGSGPTRSVAYEHHALGEVGSLWLTRQLAADPLDAGISPVAPVGSGLSPRLRVPVQFSEQASVAVLICMARPDSALSGRDTAVTQIFRPRSFSEHGPPRLTTFDRSAFDSLLERVRGDLETLEKAGRDWDVTRLIAEDIDRISKTTRRGKTPSRADKDAIFLAPRAVRNIVAISPPISARLAELDYAYRRYEVLR